MMHALLLTPRDVAREAASSPSHADALSAVWDLVEAIGRSKQAAVGASPSRAVLIRLAKLGPTRVTALAAALGLDQSTVSRHLASLAEQGLVERDVDPADRRAHRMAITPTGYAVAREAVAARVAMFEQVIADWSEADRATFARLLTAFTTTLNDQKEPIHDPR